MQESDQTFPRERMERTGSRGPFYGGKDSWHGLGRVTSRLGEARTLAGREGMRPGLAIMKLPSSHPNTSEERCHCYEGWVAQYLLLGIFPFQALAVRVLVLEAGSFPETSWVLRDSGPLPQPWYLNAVAGYVPLFHAVLLSWGACWGLLTLAGPLAHLWLLLTSLHSCLPD